MAELHVVGEKVSSSGSSWEDKLHQYLLRPHLSKPNGMFEAISALASADVLNMLWSMPSEGHKALAWWLAPQFIKALRELPFLRALEAMAELAAIHVWIYDKICSSGRYSALEYETPVFLLRKVVPPEYGIESILKVFSDVESEHRETATALRGLCQLLAKLPEPHRSSR